VSPQQKEEHWRGDKAAVLSYGDITGGLANPKTRKNIFEVRVTKYLWF
jgi:hypothetical protein